MNFNFNKGVSRFEIGANMSDKELGSVVSENNEPVEIPEFEY